jgi:hypothetical protein
MNDAQPFRACIHGEPGPAGHCPHCGAQLVRNPPSRLDRAKAALEEAEANCTDMGNAAYAALGEHKHAQAAYRCAKANLAAAEAEAARLASIAAIPPLLLEVAREIGVGEPYDSINRCDVWKLLARSHGIPPGTLRERLANDH